MSNRKRRDIGDRLNAFDPNTKTDLEEFTDQIYGASEGPILDTGRVVARPTPITDIWADLAQPRRAVPASVRGDWAGDPRHVPALLEAWHTAAQTAGGIRIDPARFLEGNENTEKWPETLPALTAGYVDLLRLAATIFRDGLINPIGVVQRGRGNYLIETGERRWLAHHLLDMYRPDEGFERIAAVQGKTHDVWRQATENTARRALGPIGMARQLALLIMDVRRQEQARHGAAYDSYETLIAPGGCDRRFYAQVADGNLHRIPKGDAERIQAAMGLSSKQMLGYYRKLLALTESDEINDILWTRADVEDWPERVLRDIGRSTMVDLRAVLSRENWTLEDLRALVDEQKEAKAARDMRPAYAVGDAVLFEGQLGMIRGVTSAGIMVHFTDGDDRYIEPHRLERTGMLYRDYVALHGGPSRPATPPVQKESQAGDVPDWYQKPETDVPLIDPERAEEYRAIGLRMAALSRIGDTWEEMHAKIGIKQSFQMYGEPHQMLIGPGRIQFKKDIVSVAAGDVIVICGVGAMQSAARFNAEALMAWKLANAQAQEPEVSSDNAHSLPEPAPAAGGEFLIESSHMMQIIIEAIDDVAEETGDMDARYAVKELREMTIPQLLALYKNKQGATDALGHYYDLLKEKLRGWMDGPMAAWFQSVEDQINNS